MDIRNCSKILNEGPSFSDVNPGEVFRATDARYYMKVESATFDLAVSICDGKQARFASGDPVTRCYTVVDISHRYK